MIGSRFKTYFDFGYVALDILSATSEDTGIYTVVARNSKGQVQIETQMQVTGKFRKSSMIVMSRDFS